MQRWLPWCGLLALVPAMMIEEPAPGPAAPARTVVFVCEHGSAKSLVAASFFGRIAQERGLAVEASSRGTAPDASVPEPVARALGADGFDVAAFRPRALSEADVDGAVRVVAIGVDTGALGRMAGERLERWDDIPPVSTDYARARQALVRRVEALIRDLERARRR